MSMDTEASLREYLKLNLKIPVVGRIGPLAKAFDFVATAAPGVREILTVGKLCYEVRERHYDLVVVDAPATGHIVGQLAAPQAINDLVKVGLIRTQTDWMLDILSDPARTGLVAVTTPEEMPVAETLELADRVAAETTVRLSGVVVNRVLPELFGRQRRRGLRTPAPSRPGSNAWPTWSAATSDRCSRAPGSPSRCAGPGPSTSQRLREGLDPSVPVLLPAVPVRAVPRAADHRARWRRRSARSSGSDGRATAARTGAPASRLASTACWRAKEIVIACGPGGVGKTTTAAAARRHGRLPPWAARCSS